MFLFDVPSLVLSARWPLSSPLHEGAINTSDLGMLQTNAVHPGPPVNTVQGIIVRRLVRMAIGRAIAPTALGTTLLHLGTVQYTSMNLRLWGVVSGIIVASGRLIPVWRSAASLGRWRFRGPNLEDHTRRLLRLMSMSRTWILWALRVRAYLLSSPPQSPCLVLAAPTIHSWTE